ncbi:hypothetical protein ACHWQZ_G008943 [Mnemiopsis leidyi]
MEISTSISEDQDRSPSGVDLSLRIKNFLKVEKARKWCCYEWFYSNIDRLIFLGKNDFVTCVQSAYPDIEPGTKLTRLQWSIVRRSLGKPRRCSPKFFEEERMMLEAQRNRVRELQQGKVNPDEADLYKDLADEVPSMLIIGTSVTAQIKDGLFVGEVEAVDPTTNSYRIRFDRPGLGTHTVPDYNVLSNGEVDMISKDTLFSQETTDILPTVVLPQANLSSYMTTEHGISTGFLGGYPVPFLRCIVKMNKLLKVKRDLLNKIKNLNSTVERKTSFREPLDSGTQLMYATVVLDLDKLNKLFQTNVKDLQQHCKTHLGSETLAAMQVKSSCMEAAELLVKEANQLIKLKHEKSTKFVAELTALLIQVERLSTSKNTNSMPVLNESIRNLRSIVHPSNLHSFQENVEVPLAHIQARLKQEFLSNPD